MGTKVHYKSYIRENNLVKGHDNDGNGSWPMFYDGRNLNGHLNNDFRLMRINGYSEYDKEMLKRTMLEHEAIFRKQVCELHRLYRIQKNLMDGLKKRDFYGYSIQMNTSQASPLNSYSSKIPLEDQQQNLHVAHMPNGNGFDWRVPTAGLVDIRESAVQSGQSSVENGDSLKDDQLLESKSNRKFCRRTFDLELPADVYIDDEEIERSENDYAAESSFHAVDFLDRSHSLESKNDVKLTLGHGEHSIPRYESQRSESKLKRELSVSRLSDLNGPVRECSNEGASGSTSSYYFGPRTQHAGIRENKLMTLTTTAPSFLQEHYLIDKCKDEGGSSNFLKIDVEETRQQSPFLGTDSGILSSVVDKREHWFEQKPHDSIDLSVGNPQLDSLKKVMADDPPKTDMFTAVPSDHRVAASLLDFSLRKPKNRISRPPIAVQALACFNTSAAMNLVHNGDYRSCLKRGTEPFACPNVPQKSFPGSDSIFYSDHPSVSYQKPKQNSSSTKSAFRALEGYRPQKCSKFSHCKDPKSLKDLNLNEPLSRENQDGSVIADQVINESSGGLSRLRKETSCDESVRVNTSKMEINSSSCFPQLLSSFTSLDPELNRKTDEEKAPAASDPLTFPLTTGFPVLEKIQQSSTCSLSADHPPRLFTGDAKFNQGEGLHYSKDCTLTLDGRDPRSDINLNSLMPCLENPKSLPVPAAKLTLEIDLEASASCQLEDISPIISMPESLSVKRQSHNTDCSKETEELHDRCIREAAEIIISMSLDIRAKIENLTCHTLHWFAETVSSNAEKELKRGADQVSETLNDDKLDLFELMTLKLEETKVNEYWCQTQEPVNPKDERKCTAALLLTRPRRGQGRKRRQRRDFQKDILPGLASLARHEVTEDLKVIRGLLMDSGCSWQMGSTRRNRNWTQTGTGARGRRRVRSKPVTVPEIKVCPLAAKPSSAELEVDGKGMVGWGRTTRRCHRLRCSTGDGHAPLV